MGKEIILSIATVLCLGFVDVCAMNEQTQPAKISNKLVQSHENKDGEKVKCLVEVTQQIPNKPLCIYQYYLFLPEKISYLLVREELKKQAPFLSKLPLRLALTVTTEGTETSTNYHFARSFFGKVYKVPSKNRPITTPVRTTEHIDANSCCLYQLPYQPHAGFLSNDDSLHQKVSRENVTITMAFNPNEESSDIKAFLGNMKNSIQYNNNTVDIAFTE